LLTIINDDFIDGDFLEKYLTLILRLKVVISGAEFFFIDNLFYNIDYITYISVGHGVSFFKHFLYSENNYYGNKRFNQILIPPSEKLISVAKQYGWKDKDIIKMNLPRWDKYNDFESLKKEECINHKNIFVMFTWRQMKERKNISNLYFENINGLLNNKFLLRNLDNYNITLYFAFHRQIWNKLKSKSKLKINKHIKYIEEKEISIILSNTSLVVTDFSSIIFDIIYREKPFVIFIPDSNDPNLSDIYSDFYYQLIKDIKDGVISFQNTFFSIEDTVKKINFFIKNNFILEPKLKMFYNNFGFKKENSTNKFIEYLKNLQ
jgi:CDP-glycerol glycerophosphotransferase (TagB/SpsB family)